MSTNYSGKITSSTPLPFLLVAIGYIILITLDSIFFQDRVFYSDSAYYLFQIINTEKFHFEHGRYGAFLSQILPLSALKLHASLSTIAILYSASIHILTFGWSLSIYFTKKGDSIVFITAVFLIQVLTIRHNWFWPVSELMQALVLMSIGFYYLQEKRKILSTLLFIIVLLTHPSAAPVMIALLIANISKDDFKKYISISIIAAIIFILLPRSDYEKEKMSAFLDFSTILNSHFWIFLKNSLFKVYIFLVPLIGYVLYKNRKNTVFIITSIIFTVLWICLTAASEQNGNSLVLLENAMLPVSAFWIISAAFTKPSVSALSATSFITMSFFLLYVMVLQRKIYGPNTELRVNNIINWKSKFSTYDSFIIIDESLLIANDKIMKNRIPVEYILQSTLQFDGKPIFIIIDSFIESKTASQSKLSFEKIMLGDGLPIINRYDLNEKYFKVDSNIITNRLHIKNNIAEP